MNLKALENYEDSKEMRDNSEEKQREEVGRTDPTLPLAKYGES